MKVLLNSFHLNDYKLGFNSHNKKVEPSLAHSDILTLSMTCKI